MTTVTGLEHEFAQEQKGRIIRDLAHELRTPLTTIKTLARLLQRERETVSERHEYLREIIAACDREIAVILNLLDLLRIEANALRIAPTRVDVATLIRDLAVSIRPAATRGGLELRVEAPDGLPDAAADYTALRRALEILLENGIKHTAPGGQIVLQAQSAGAEVIICVTDTGRGIEVSDAPHVFDRFDRDRLRSALDGSSRAASSDDGAESASAGLSLYLTRAMVREMGGSVTVESAPHRHPGSRFIVRLPALSG